MPPIFADDDAVLISHRIDAFLVVVEDGRTTRKQVRDTIRMLSPTPVLGTVLNRYPQPAVQRRIWLWDELRLRRLLLSLLAG